MPEFKTKLIYLCRLCGVRDDSFTITQTAKDLEYCGLRTHTRDANNVTVLPSLARVPMKRVHQCTPWLSGIADLYGAETVNPVDGNESAGENLKAGFQKKAKVRDNL